MDAAEPGLRYLHLRSMDFERRARLCWDFYEQIYRAAFPKSDQAEGPDIWLPLLDDSPPAGQPLVYIVLAVKGVERILGGIVFEFYRNTGCWLATYVATRPDMRHRGIATGLVREAVHTINARNATNWILFAEAENPARIVDAAERAAAEQRLSELEGLGMRRLPVAYVQPALAPGKHVLDDLFLLCYAPADEPELACVPSVRVAEFLAEFYSALGQSDSPHLQRMRADLTESDVLRPVRMTPLSRHDDVLGTAKSISMRLTFFHAHAVRQSHWRRKHKPEREEIPLDPLRKALSRLRLTESLSSAVQSFQDDIITPYATESSLPLVVLCEPFEDEKNHGRGTSGPHPVKIEIPSEFVMRWEKRDLVVHFSADDGPYCIYAKMVDNVTFFESGYIAYSVSFIFEAGGNDVPLNASVLLVLEALAKPAGVVLGKPVRFSIGGENPKPLREFLRNRIRDLAVPRPERRTVFSLFASEIADIRMSKLKETLLRLEFPQTEVENSETTMDTEQDEMDDVPSIVSIGIEIIDASKHDEVLRCAAEARKRMAQVDPFSKRLAGLVQNVLDFEQQDTEEVHDSLASYAQIGSDITFGHKDVAVRFSRNSRPYRRMIHIIGGSPYWLLVQLVLGHNEMLLSDLNNDLKRHQGQGGLTGMMRGLLSVRSRFYNIRDTEERLRRTLGRRIRLAHYIPNLFRYPTEQTLYKLLVSARGLEAQHAYFHRLEDTLEATVREIAILNKERADARITRMLLALGFVQVAGVLVGLAVVGTSDFQFFAKHLNLQDALTFLDELRPGRNPDDMFRAVWALMPALVIMFFGFLIMGLIGFSWMAYWLLARLRRR